MPTASPALAARLLLACLLLCTVLLGCDDGNSLPPPNEADSAALQAAQDKDWDAVFAALDDGASPDAIWEEQFANYSLLEYAVDQNNADAAARLIDAGADVNLPVNHGKTSLFRATQYERIEMARLLIDAGADVNVQDDSGETAMHNMASWSVYDPELYRLLLDHGADPDLADEYGFAVLHMLTLYAEPGVVPDNKDETTALITLLVEAGADPHLKSLDGESPIDFARDGEQPDWLAALQSGE